MRIRIYVEGESERVGLSKLLALVNPSRLPVAVLPLKGSRFLSEIGFRAAEILCAESDAHVFACPDLLKRRLRTDTDITKHCNKSPEDQNFDEYPKKVARRLFSKFLRTRYSPVADCACILEYLTPEHVESIERTCPRVGEFLATIRHVFAA